MAGSSGRRSAARDVSPARLFVYLAREAPIGVVLRRGPSAWARLSVWHTDNDEIDPGQWIHARVYERRCDVSTDGSLFAAFIRKGGPVEAGEPASDSWVAVSRPPWFSALAVWLLGSTWHTGPFFPDASSLWLGYTAPAQPDTGELPAWLRLRHATDIPYIDRTSEWTDRTVHFNRLLRDGWQLLESDAYRSKWQREQGGLTLVMYQRFEGFAVHGGPYAVEYMVRDETGERQHEIGRVDWADWDQGGRLVLARGGCLYAWQAPDAFSLIADFNGERPEAMSAPAAARKWPRRPRRT